MAAGLSLLPADDYVTLAAVVLRQPKREEEILHPCWGRMVGYANIGRPQDGTAAGPVVMLEAMKPDRVWWLDKSMGPAAAAEAERLAQDGHKLIWEQGRIRVESTIEATRATQLYRTLPHEIGHMVDYATKVPDVDESKGISIDRHIELSERFRQRPSQEREAFAHRYADEFRVRMMALGLIPFSRIEV